MSEVAGYFKVSELPIVEEVPEGATVLAYNEGQLMRVDGSKVGGGVAVVEFIPNMETREFSCTHTYDEVLSLVSGSDGYIIRAKLPEDATGTSISILNAVSVGYIATDGLIGITMLYGSMQFVFEYKSDGTITYEQQ